MIVSWRRHGKHQTAFGLEEAFSDVADAFGVMTGRGDEYTADLTTDGESVARALRLYAGTVSNT